MSQTVSDLDAAAEALINELKVYSRTALRSMLPDPSESVAQARRKIEIAKKIVKESGIGQALGTTVLQAVRAQEPMLNFSTIIPNASEITILDDRLPDFLGGGTDQSFRASFTMQGRRYSIRIVENTSEFFDGDNLVLQTKSINKLSHEFSNDEYDDVSTFVIGPWIKVLLDIAARIEADYQIRRQSTQSENILKTAAAIDLGA